MSESDPTSFTIIPRYALCSLNNCKLYSPANALSVDWGHPTGIELCAQLSNFNYRHSYSTYSLPYNLLHLRSAYLRLTHIRAAYIYSLCQPFFAHTHARISGCSTAGSDVTDSRARIMAASFFRKSAVYVCVRVNYRRVCMHAGMLACVHETNVPSPPPPPPLPSPPLCEHVNFSNFI